MVPSRRWVFQVREIVRLAVGLVTRCDDRRANAGRESYGLELDVPAARDANGQLPMQVVGLADQVRAGLGNVVGRGSLETMGFQVREIVRLAVGLLSLDATTVARTPGVSRTASS